MFSLFWLNKIFQCFHYFSLYDVFFKLFLQNVGVIVVAASVIPLILIPVVPLLLIFLYLRSLYLRTSRDIKRLESIWKGQQKYFLSFHFALSTARSPVLSHLSSSLNGLSTIRASRSEEKLKKYFDAHQDLHSGLLFENKHLHFPGWLEFVKWLINFQC